MAEFKIIYIPDTFLRQRIYAEIPMIKCVGCSRTELNHIWKKYYVPLIREVLFTRLDVTRTASRNVSWMRDINNLLQIT